VREQGPAKDRKYHASFLATNRQLLTIQLVALHVTPQWQMTHTAIICPILFCAAHGETRDVLLHAFAYNNQIEQTILFFFLKNQQEHCYII
jgi:hypothetical protein